METFKIWSTFDLKGDALEKMKLFHKETVSACASLKNFKTEIQLTSSSIRELKGNVSSLNSSLGTLKTKADHLTSSFSRFNELLSNKTAASLRNITQDIFKFSERIDMASPPVHRLANTVKDLKWDLHEMTKSSKKATESLHELGDARISAGGKIRISNSSGGAGLRGAAKAEESSLLGGIAGGALIASKAFPHAMMVGGGVAIGYGAYKAFHSGFESNKEYQQQIAQLKGGGLKNSELKDAKSYLEHLNIRGVSDTDKVKAYNDAFMASRDPQEAKLLTGPLAKAAFAGKAYFGKSMTDFQVQNMVKFAEIKSGSDMSKISPNLDLAMKLMNASAGTLNPSKLVTFMTQAGSAASHISDIGFAKLEPVFQEIGAKAGTSYQTLFQKLSRQGASSIMNQSELKELVRLGVFEHPEYKKGKIKSATVNKELFNTFLTDPFEFFMNVDKRMEKLGIVNTKDKVQEYGLIYGNNPGRLATAFNKNQGKSRREAELFPEQQNIADSHKYGLLTPAGASLRLESSLSSLSLAFGEFSSPAVLKGMNLLAAFFEKLASLLQMFNNLTLDSGNKNFKAGLQTMAKANPMLAPLVSIDNMISGTSYPGYNNDYYGGYAKNIYSKTFEKSPGQKDESWWDKLWSKGDVKENAPTFILQVDGKVLGQVAAKEMSKSMSSGGTMSGQNGVNSSLSPVPVGLGYFGGAY
jgi:hypothetical protein